jgi:hypothetical protein
MTIRDEVYWIFYNLYTKHHKKDEVFVGVNEVNDVLDIFVNKIDQRIKEEQILVEKLEQQRYENDTASLDEVYSKGKRMALKELKMEILK